MTRFQFTLTVTQMPARREQATVGPFSTKRKRRRTRKRKLKIAPMLNHLPVPTTRLRELKFTIASCRGNGQIKHWSHFQFTLTLTQTPTLYEQNRLLRLL